MSVVYKGFVVGNVAAIELVNSREAESAESSPEHDEVKVSFHIFDEYIDRVREGSLVNVIVSPIGLGNQFHFYPGLGDSLAEDSFIPLIDSYEARQLMAQGLTLVSEAEDNLSALFTQASDLLQNLNMLLVETGDAIIGTDATALGRIIGGVDETVTSISSVASNIDAEIAPILQEIQTTVSSLNEKLNDPNGMLSSLLTKDGMMFADLENSLHSLSGTLNNIEKISGTQLSGTIEDVRVAIRSAEDVLESLKNNPLLKKGFTENLNVESGGNNPREISF
jgi:phospholipid/cholesterol/gamma-HCH transport system substrate-binding protein